VGCGIPFIFVSDFTRKQTPPAYAIAPMSPSRSRRMRSWRCCRRSWGGEALAEPAKARSSEETAATEHDHLAQAVRHIARAEEMVMEQRDLIDRMGHHGHDTKLAGRAAYDAEQLGSRARASRDDRTRHRCRTKAAMGSRLRLKAAPPLSHFILVFT